MDRLSTAVGARRPPPRLAGRYVVTQLLGKGAQARVYLAFDTRNEVWRAVKVLASRFVRDEGVRRRFVQEADLLKRLSHRSLIDVLDVGVDGQVPFIVMELAAGGSMVEWMRRHGSPSPALACHVGLEVCDALSHVHEAGVVHRDVKPHNLLLRADGSLVLTDFGIAQVDDAREKTAAGTIMGTFAYMAPEQRRDSHAVDGRADIYALGATLYTLLTLRTSSDLFFAETADTLLDGIPEVLRPIILTACQYEPRHRYPDVLALRDALSVAIAAVAGDHSARQLASQVLQLPDRPPTRIDHDPALDDLRAMLQGVDAPSVAELEERLHAMSDDPLDEQPTTLYTDSKPPDDNLDEAQILSPQTPVLRRRWAPRRVDNSLSPPVQVPPKSSAKRRREARPTASALPTYVDPTTMVPPDPRARGGFVVTATGTYEQPTATEPEPKSGALQAVAAALTAVFCLVLVLVVHGLGNAALSARAVDTAAAELLVAVHDESALVSALADRGVDVHDAFFAIEEAPTAQRAGLAVDFVDQVVHRSAGLELQGVPLGQRNRIQRAGRSYRSNVAWSRSARQGWAGSLAGSIGL